jgi:hypothetical protein
VNFANAAICRACDHDVTYRRPSLWRQLRDNGVPLWRCLTAFVLGAVGLPLLFGGVLLFVWVFFPINLKGMGWSAGAALAGAGGVWAAVRLTES